MAELRSLLGDSVSLETRFPSDHSRSRSVHPQPLALADYPRSLFGFPFLRFRVAFTFSATPAQTNSRTPCVRKGRLVYSQLQSPMLLAARCLM
jgi:hypothetical protein